MPKQKKSKDVPGVPDGTPTFKRPLPVELTDDELQKKGKRAAKVEDEVDELEKQLKEQGADLRKQIKERRAVVRQLLREVSTGREDRDVVCYEAPDFNRGEVRVVRSDTGRTVEARTMTADDRQEDMGFVTAAKAPKVPKTKKNGKPHLEALPVQLPEEVFGDDVA